MPGGAPGTARGRTWSSRRPGPRSTLARGRRNETVWLQREEIWNSDVKQMHVHGVGGGGGEGERMETVCIYLYLERWSGLEASAPWTGSYAAGIV